MDNIEFGNVNYIPLKHSDSHYRTQELKRQIRLSFFLQPISLVLSFMIIPLMIRYLGIELYGIWVTWLSILYWINFLDFGIGNGLRNELAKELAIGNRFNIKTYISTSYIILGIISFFVFLIIFIITLIINWQSFFNTTILNKTIFSYFVIITSFFFLLNFPLNIINQIVNANQRPSMSVLNQVLYNILFLGFISLLLFIPSSLLDISIVYGFSLTIANFIISYLFYKNNHDQLLSYNYLSLNKIKGISSIGLKFFLIQISGILIVMANNVIITFTLGPIYVTSYDIVLKLFGLITFGFSIIIVPFWSAFTDAYSKNDIFWIKNTIKKLHLIIFPIYFVIFLLVLLAKVIIGIWIGNNLIIDNNLIILTGIYTALSIWNGIYATIMNGLGRINFSLLLAVLGGLINVPLAIFLAKYYYTSGILLSTIITLMPAAVLIPVQYIIIFYTKLEDKNKILHTLFK